MLDIKALDPTARTRQAVLSRRLYFQVETVAIAMHSLSELSEALTVKPVLQILSPWTSRVAKTLHIFLYKNKRHPWIYCPVLVSSLLTFYLDKTTAYRLVTTSPIGR